MRYKIFGRCTGLRVSEYVLGTSNFGSSVSSAGLVGSKEIVDAFTAAGGTTFDVSNIYQNGEAEAVLGGLLEQNATRSLTGQVGSEWAHPTRLLSRRWSTDLVEIATGSTPRSYRSHDQGTVRKIS